MSFTELPSADDLAAILGGTVVERAEAQDLLEHMYKPQEAVFGAVAHAMVAAGWSVFPQEVDGNRRPGTVNNEMIKWSEKYQLAVRRPEPDVLDLWAAQCSTLNVAVVLGPASGHAFVIDIDVVEAELSAQVVDLAERILGHTPLQRVGRWPKMALVYRHAPDDEVAGRRPKFVHVDSPDNPDRSEQGIEIITAGMAMTFFGKHHKTGRYFRWLEGTPERLGPDHAPVVTSSQVNEFLDAVDSIRPFHRNAAAERTVVQWEWDEKAKVHVPRVRPSGGASDWIEDENGTVVDGREAYLTRLAFRIVLANGNIALGGEQGEDKLVEVVHEQFMATAETTGRWKGASLLREVRSKVRRAIARIKDGTFQPRAPERDERGNYVVPAGIRSHVPPQPRYGKVDSLDFLPPFFDPEAPPSVRQRNPLPGQLHDPQEGEAQARALEPDRTRIAGEVQEALQGAFSAFWDEVYDTDRTDTRIHILKAPTGAGKTSRGISFIADDPRTKDDYTVRGPNGEIVSEGRCPIVFLLPTYANIEELRDRAQVLNLDGGLSDEDLRAQAEDRGLMHEDDLPARLAELRRDARNAGLRTMIYQGKLKAGCQMADKVSIAMAAGIGTSSLCKAEVPTKEKDGRGKPVMETRYCKFYNTCPAIQQKKEIEKSHVVFMPHAFLQLNIPEELKNVRAVVADERIHHLFLHTTEFDLDIFTSPRKPPKLRKREKEDGVDPGEFEVDRQEAARTVRAALLKRECPAEAMAQDRTLTPQGEYVSLKRIDSALRVCGASIARDGNVTPDISLEELQEICSRPTGQQVREELRFWKIMEERVSARIKEVTEAELAAQGGSEPLPRRTKGDREMRIQYVEDEYPDGEPKGKIRISWRETPNWVERPLLLLDASAAPDMISKIWDGKEVVTHDVPAALNVRVVSVADRTYSNSLVVASPKSSAKEKAESARILANVRRAISTISAMYGWSRVVAGASILVRRAVNTSWEGPSNVDWCHYGAMRGLDFAKHHAAAISVGRMELPVRTLDGLVAALTYDDDVPEQPFDTFGTGLSRDNLPLRMPVGVQRVRLRSGHDVSVPVPMFPGKWGRMIQKQYREEELLQFLGRLRPVYREGEAPVWFSLSSVIPEEIVVDDIIRIEDLVTGDCKVWDAMRRCGGVVEPRLAAAACDDLFPSPARAARDMQSAGADPEDGELDPRVGWGLAAWRFRDSGGHEGFAFARADMEDQEAALRNAFSGILGLELLELGQHSQGRARTLAKGRRSDKIEDELGTLTDRGQMERKKRMDAAIELLMNTPPEAIEHLRGGARGENMPMPLALPVLGEEEGAVITMDVAEASAGSAIRDLWLSLGAGAGDAKPALGKDSALVQAEAGEREVTYEDAAAHVKDGGSELMYSWDSLDNEIPW